MLRCGCRRKCQAAEWVLIDKMARLGEIFRYDDEGAAFRCGVGGIRGELGASDLNAPRKAVPVIEMRLPVGESLLQGIGFVLGEDDEEHRVLREKACSPIAAAEA